VYDLNGIAAEAWEKMAPPAPRRQTPSPQSSLSLRVLADSMKLRAVVDAAPLQRTRNVVTTGR
jgi:hypothetical protein